MDLSLDYHTYGMTWLPENITLYLNTNNNTNNIIIFILLIQRSYFDGEKTKSFKPSDLTSGAFDITPHFWILNTAVGGNYPQNPKPDNVWPALTCILFHSPLCFIFHV